MIQTHRLWEQLRETRSTTEEGPDGVKTYYIVLDGEELRAWQDSGKKGDEISEWKQTQGLPTFHHLRTTAASPQLRCEFGCCSHEFYYCAGERVTTLGCCQPLPTCGTTAQPTTHLQEVRSDYLELENHSDALRNMDTFTTPTVIIIRLQLPLHCADVDTTLL